MGGRTGAPSVTPAQPHRCTSSALPSVPNRPSSSIPTFHALAALARSFSIRVSAPEISVHVLSMDTIVPSPPAMFSCSQKQAVPSTEASRAERAERGGRAERLTERLGQRSKNKDKAPPHVSVTCQGLPNINYVPRISCRLAGRFLSNFAKRTFTVNDQVKLINNLRTVSIRAFEDKLFSIKCCYPLDLPNGEDLHRETALLRLLIGEDSWTLSRLLRLLYPADDPVLSSLDTIKAVLATALKYEMNEVTELEITRLHELGEPLAAWAVAHELGLTEERCEAARRTLGLSPAELTRTAERTLLVHHISANCVVQLTRYHWDMGLAGMHASAQSKNGVRYGRKPD
ncbi:hypothetical protein OBBRIDRAFT_399133 [Obba rivulosa]|uniref:BTB domain-containing protein n=1 Tax=Obba rivulosa TaxID=1052685 RepID=A0A8E2AHC6_9APHY|nr:hypothetical protein OBBRIDRAFT_399133 [Obba rivulosa]